MKPIKCPKCNKKLFKDKVGNYFVIANKFGMMISHNVECDNKYLEDKND